MILCSKESSIIVIDMYAFSGVWKGEMLFPVAKTWSTNACSKATATSLV